MPGQAIGIGIEGFKFKHGISQGYVNACKGITWRNTMSQPLQSSSKKTPWCFLVTGGTGNTYGLFIGEVTAVDPRDAVIRALTSETAAGKYIGEHIGIPIDVVLGVPCNDDISYALTRGDIVIKVKRTSLASFEAPDDWPFGFTPYRHGGWYTTVRYPSRANGCVSRDYPDGKWRIVCDRRSDDITYPTREAATRAEYVLAQLQEIGLYPKARIKPTWPMPCLSDADSGTYR